MYFGFDMAQNRTTLRCDAGNAPERIQFQSDLGSGGGGARESWTRRQGWAAARHENGWPCCGRRGAYVMRRRGDHRGIGIAVTLNKRTTHADGVPADPHEIGRTSRDSHTRQVACASGDSESDADETQSCTLVKPANRGADTPSRTDTDAIGDEESLAVTDPRGDHHDPDSDCSAESVDCYAVGDYQPIADCQPIAVLVRGG